MSATRDVTIRPADPDRDAHLIRAVDTSFETSTIFEVIRDEFGFRLAETSVDPPIRKVFPLDDLGEGRRWDRAWLAVSGEAAVGFVATRVRAWNRRVVIWHLYVNPGHRRGGVGRALLDIALEAAAQAGARSAWVETSNLNVPGYRAYRRLGFELCGLDVGLYEGTSAEGEIALFLERPL